MVIAGFVGLMVVIGVVGGFNGGYWVVGEFNSGYWKVGGFNGGYWGGW